MASKTNTVQTDESIVISVSLRNVRRQSKTSVLIMVQYLDVILASTMSTMHMVDNVFVAIFPRHQTHLHFIKISLSIEKMTCGRFDGFISSSLLMSTHE